MDRRRNDIERYLRGEMSPGEMHALEREAMKDPFLSEALEGVEQTGAQEFLLDLRELHHTVHQRARSRRPKFISMWNWSIGIAAGLIIIALAAVYIISGVTEGERQTLALKKEALPQPGHPTPADTLADASQPASPPAREESATGPATAAVPQPQEVETDAPEETEISVDDGMASRDAVDETSPTEAVDPIAIPALDPVAGIAIADTVRVIEGRVISAEDGTALPGVTIRIQDAPTSTSTDATGNFTIPVVDEDQALVFNFVGMEEKVVPTAGKQHLDVTLEPDLTQLSEVVVIGYGDDDKKLPSKEYAAPTGGRKALEKYLEEKMNYPEQALLNNVEGRVTIEFTVWTDGTLRDFQVLKGLGFGCDDEAIRLLREGPAWSPSKRDAQPVAEKVKVRVKFSLPRRE